jgi:hypothetical protein
MYYLKAEGSSREASIPRPLVRRLGDTHPETKGEPMTSHAAPSLLNDDGTASMATMLLMSHHAFRRDLARFARALAAPGGVTPTQTSALEEEWRWFRTALHGHHEAEDAGLFPGLRREHADLVAVLDGLTADHRRIDPLLADGDRSFADLGARQEGAVATVAALSALLDAHLATEESRVIGFLRAANAFPAPGSDGEADMYAQGFAWSAEGVADEVLARVFALLPPILTTRLPAARAAFAERCARVWGPARSGASGASRTSIPDWLAR